MNKQDAAQFLGVSVRTLESYVAQGRLSVSYVRGKTRPIADFNAEELEIFRSQPPVVAGEILSSQSVSQTAQNSENPEINAQNLAASNSETPKKQTAQNSVKPSAALARIEKNSETGNPASGAFFVVGGQEMAQLLKAASEEKPQTPQNLAAKFLLSLPEAQSLTGLSRETLRSAIGSGELKAKQIGKAWRIRPEDLREWLAKTFN